MGLVPPRGGWMRPAGIVVCVVGVRFPSGGRECRRIRKIGRDTKDNELLRSVRRDCANELAARVVVHLNLDTMKNARFERPIDRIEWLIFFYNATLVVVDLPAADDDVDGIVRSSHATNRRIAFACLVNRQPS